MRQALGYGRSSKDLTNAEFDLVKAAFLAISRPADLDAQIRQLDQAKKRLIYRITHEQAALLSVLMHVPPGIEPATAAESYILSVCQDKFGTQDIASISTESRPRGKYGYHKSDLETLRDTLDARISALRRERGLSVADLHRAAGVQFRSKPSQQAA